MTWLQSIAALAAQQRRLLGVLATVAIAALAFLALRHLLRSVDLHEVRTAFHLLRPRQVALSMAFTALSYLALTLYDVLALHVVGRLLPYRTAALASFTSYTLSHNFGLSLLTGGSARYRVYSAAGLGAGDIARVVAIAGLAFWSGVFILAGLALGFHRAPLALGAAAIPPLTQHIAGFALMAAFGFLIVGPLRNRRAVRLFTWSLPLPNMSEMGAQLAVALIDLGAACTALFVLIPPTGANGFIGFFLSYAMAMIVALVSHVPGGIGVFEATILATLPGVSKPALLAAFIAYRLIYYLLPLSLGALMLALREGWQWRRPVRRALAGAQMVAAGLAPLLLSALVFTGGIILLVSGSLPAVPARLQSVRTFVPLPFIEASHIAASLVGTALLLLAPGLYRRLDGAFVATRALLLAGVLFSFAKGFDYEEAAVLLAISGILQWTRPAFYRRTSLTAYPLSPRCIAAVAVSIALSLWIGFFSYKHVAYQDDLWWRFTLNGDASRFLRASFGAIVLLAAGIFWRLFGPAPIQADAAPITPDPLQRALALSGRSEAMLALTGDKRFLRSPAGDAFLMYQMQGQSWIVMGDPVGARAAWPELLWRIRELADAAQGRLLLYQLSPDSLPLVIDMGLQLIKYGEVARVGLADFTLDGPAMKGLRHAVRRAEREGAQFEILPAAQVPLVTDALRAVSDEWLNTKAHREKTFSLGRFATDYLAHFDCAVVRHRGQIVAFANIWATADRNELSVDLMRYLEGVPYGTMDLLFARLMLWGKSQAYRWFNLGAAPLAGLEARRLAPFWSQAGALLYRHGESLYGFEGLRLYKEKFAPGWEPRYIAGPHGLGLPRALLDLQRLIGGGKASAAYRAALPRGRRRICGGGMVLEAAAIC